MATEVTSINHLPSNTVQAILSSFPVKTLLTLRSVSKSWRTIISDPSFHLQPQHPHNLFLHISSNPSNDFKRDCISLIRVMNDGSFQSESILRSPRPSWHILVLSTCLGVVLLTDDYKSQNSFMLWNPSARFKTFFRYPCKYDYWRATYGLCYDPATGDFKAVLACDKTYAVYSCKNRSWTDKRDFRFGSFDQFDSKPGIFTDGVIYWVTIDGEIIYFDPRDGEFKILEKPEKIAEEISNSKMFYLDCLRDCLCLYCHTRLDKTAVRVWVKGNGMVRDTWNELMMVEIEEQPKMWFRLLCLLEDNDKILLQTGRWKYVVYSRCEETFEVVQDQWPLVDLFPCRESLLLAAENLRRPKRKRPLKLKKRYSK